MRNLKRNKANFTWNMISIFMRDNLNIFINEQVGSYLKSNFAYKRILVFPFHPQMSCRSLSRVIEQEVITPTESSVGSHELQVKTGFPVRQVALSSNGDFVASSNGENIVKIHQIFFDGGGKLNVREYATEITKSKDRLQMSLNWCLTHIICHVYICSI